MHASPKNDLREGGAWTPTQRRKNTLIYLTLRVAIALACILPRPLLFAVCRLLAFVAYLALPRERRRARARLEHALGLPIPQARVRAAARSLGHTLADTLLLLRPNETPSRTLRLDAASREILCAALAEGRGVVFITAHLGPFERMAALLAEHGFSVSTVARQSYDPRLTRLYERLRAPRGVHSIYRGTPGAVAAILRELKNGRSVGFLVDLPARVPSLPAQLFGATTLIPRGPARIALTRRAPVLVGSCQPEAAISGVPSLVTISRIPTADLGLCPQDERALIDRIARELDERIARCPEAWLGLFAPDRTQLDAIPLS